MKKRKFQLVSSTIADLLTKQIAHELKNYNLYKSFANYFSVEGIQDLEKYFNHRAEEEKNHQEWIFSYLSDGDVKFMYPAVEMNTEKVASYIDPFVFTVDREIQTTEMLYNIYTQAQSENDLMTQSWLFDKLIKEQIEEENISRMARSIMEEDSDIFIKADKVLDLIN